MRYFYTLLSLLFATYSWAQPASISVTGTFIHGESKVISGASFGSKSPAAPLIWDDGEDSVVDNDAAVAAVWDEVWPPIGFANYAAGRTRYRTIPYRSTSAPHSNSTKYLAGCHYQYAGNSPPYVGTGQEYYKNVLVTIDNGSYADDWYAHFYYTLDPLWESSTNCVNHKMTVHQTGSVAYTDGSCYSVYCSGAYAPGTATGDTCEWNDYQCTANVLGGCGSSNDTNNPTDAWIKVEQIVDAGSITNMYVDNTLAADGNSTIANIRSFSIGGYFRYHTSGSDCGDSTLDRGGVLDSNYRYFDDIYIDTTFSRVMLANNATYASATIVEPQIPSAWEADGSEIIVTVNQGALPDGTAYLFVFDSANDANATGYAVTLGGATIQGITIQ